MHSVRSGEWCRYGGVQIAHYGIPCEIAGDDRSAFDTGCCESVDDVFPAASEGAFEYQRESEPAAAADLTLNPNPFYRGHSVEEKRCIGAASPEDCRDLLELLKPESTRHFKGPDVVSRKYKAEEVIERFARFRVDKVVGRQFARPTVRPHRDEHLSEAFIVCEDESALHSGDVVGEERTECPHQTEGS